MTNYVENLFFNLKNENSDINKHLETIKNLASECDSVVEFGVRNIVSTVALIASTCKKITSYDIINPCSLKVLTCDRLKEINKHCTNNNIDFKFIEADILKQDSILECDLLLIDTLHNYAQLKSELHLFSNKVKKYIVMHDTTTFKTNDEWHIPEEEWIKKYFKVENLDFTKRGLNSAIKDFLLEEKSWKIFKIYENNNGLTILKRNN